MLVAARVMGPAEFGAFTLLLTIAVGLTRFSEAGWREYVMSSDDAGAASQANVLAIICGVGSMGVGLIAGLVLLAVVADGSTAGVMMLMAFWVLLATLTATQSGVLVRRGKLRALAFTQIAGEVAGFLAALLVFALGGGIFGLVASKLGMQVTVLGLSLLVTRWFPIVHLDGAVARDAYVFSRRILATRLISFAQDNVSIIAIGALTGPAGAGLFRAAGRLGGALFEVVSEPVRLLAWSTFRKGAPGPGADRLLRLTIIVATPLFVGLAVTAGDAVHLLLGPDWVACAPLLVAFAIAGLLNIPNIVTEPLLVLGGRIDLVPRVTLAITLLHLVFLVVLAPFGILWIAIGQAAATACMLPAILLVQKRSGGLSPGKLLRHAIPPLFGAACLVAAVWAVRAILPPDLDRWLRMAGEIAAGAGAYVAVILILVPRSVWKDAASRAP